jgi:hypothetical protein
MDFTTVIQNTLVSDEIRTEYLSHTHTHTQN